MPKDEYIFETISAGELTWFEADKVTLAEIKAKYLLEADEYLYFRKGEDWLKELINSLFAVCAGPEKILELASVCGQELIEFTNTFIDGLIELEFKDYIDWYLRLAALELARKHLLFLKKRIWDVLVKRIKDPDRPLIKLDFRILCKNSQENIDHLPRWKATGTKVRFYRDDTEAGSHRFYLNEKGYAVFWRQGKGRRIRFYGFEGTDPEIVQRLKAIFKQEWSRSFTPKIMAHKRRLRKS